MNNELKQKVVKGAIWSLMEKFGVQIVSFGVTLILARLLTPEDYGTIALLSIFTGIASSLVDSGFATALIQKKDVTEVDYNSVFYLSIVVAGILYVILFFIAPWIADFYKTPVLVSILRISAIVLFFNAVNSVQIVELKRNLRFDLSFRISLISTFSSAIVGITLAFLHFGPWALVWQTFTLGLVGVIARWFYVAWRPKLMFSFRALRTLFSFGWKLAVSFLINTIFENIYGLLIGRIYTKADLAFVNKGKTTPSLVMDSVNSTLGVVSFPALAKLQDSREQVRNGMRKLITCSTYLVMPAMAGVAVCSESLVFLLFGEKWIPCVRYMQVACFTYALWPFHTINLQAINAVGRSDLFLKLEIVKKISCVIFMIIFAYKGVFVFIAGSALILGPISVLINTWPNKRLLGYSVTMQVIDVGPTALASLAMASVCLGVKYLIILLVSNCCLPIARHIILLCVQIPLGVIFYTTITYCFNFVALREYMRILVPKISVRYPKINQVIERYFR